MKSRKSSLTFRSFEDLEDLFKTKLPSLPNPPKPCPKDDKEVQEPLLDEELFNKAMVGVTPIPRDNHVEKICLVTPPERSRDKEETESLSKLIDLVKYGKGFNVADTPEYIEGTGYNVHPDIARRLHRGDYSIEAHIDLHGFSAESAREKFEEFLRWALLKNKKGVLIVHGRGLCSPAEPVLKKKVEEWLTRGPFRKWVVAYCSARIYDGGAGATYVLLRGRPVSKRFKLGKGKLKKAQDRAT
jgi:DNA-nicking Smr family endonuclease